ncbi:MAG TPA: PDZ domain-containing protein [Candidatus Angelobacter sp.]|nr:PDZ domain-containing protein [Candidatus Angelobacter sp.]
MKKSFAPLFLFVVLFVIAASAYAAGPLLMQTPTLSKTHIAFAYAGDLWLVSREGGEARLLTSGTGTKSDPVFSPDGSMIAFTGDYDGNVDVYVMPSSGGVPRRLTYHPAVDEVVGWAPDGKSVLFRSSRNSYSRFNRLFTVSLEGGLPHELPLPTAEAGVFSPDGKHMAYVPVDNNRRLSAIGWKRYRGGKASRIWIVNLSDLELAQLPRETSNDGNPMWAGDKIYFLSDRKGPFSLYSYDLKTKKVDAALPGNGVDIKSASAGPGGIVFEQFGSLNLFDPATGKAKNIAVTVPADLPNVRPHFKKVESEIASATLSPSGARAVLEAHGEILTVPAEKGDIRNLTNTPGVMERDPAWSPDGKSVAYFSDESGEYQLFLKSPDGMSEPRKISLGNPPSFYYSPQWSPDSKKIAYTDKRLNLWYVDLAKGVPVKIDTDTYDAPQRTLDPVWAPDSRWIAYSKKLTSEMHAIFAYSLDQNKTAQLTDGLSDARFPAFDQKGQYLYFTASTDVGPTTGWLDLSSVNRPITRSAYLMVLRKDQPSPLAPESDEEKSADEAKPDADKAAKPEDKGEEAPGNPEEKAKAQDARAARSVKAENVMVRIDAENISQRILALPIPPRDYSQLLAGKAGTIFLMESPLRPGPDQPTTLWRFDLTSRKPEKLMEGANDFTVSFDGKKMLYSKGRRDNKKWFISSATAPARGEGPAAAARPETPLNLARMEVQVDPRAEWKQEYAEVWRIERDFFYDPKLHGLDLPATKKHYEPFLENVGSRIDFSYLLSDMLGELTVGHMYIRTPSDPPSEQGKVGLLGADYSIENGRYRFSKIYLGENWNPQLRAPLTQPGVNVQEGEYLLAVNGRELRGTDEVFALFAGSADKSTVLKVGPSADGKGARSVTVVPIESEAALRNRAWIEANLHKVDKLSGGKVAYVYLPDTGFGGYTSFNRYFFAQIGREGAVIDERFNGGGAAADYVIDYLRRPLQNYWMTREGQDFTTPVGAIFGPKAMIINMYAGSGGDALPWYFRDAKLGPLVGTRTWGGLVGIYDYPQLMDGGSVTAPRVAFYNRTGDWDVENHGVAPDVEVEITPKEWMGGHDPQLEKAVALVMDTLKKNPLPVAKRPEFPNYHNQPVEGVPAAAGSGSTRKKR